MTKQNGPFRIVLEFAHGEEFENAILDLLEIEMVLVEYLARVRDVEIILGRDGPGQADDPLEVRAHDRVLGRLNRNHAQAFELLLGHLEHRFRGTGFLEPPAQLFDLLIARVTFAELLLDRAHLLAQIEVLLRLGELVLDLRLDLLPELEQLDLAVEDGGQTLDAFAHVERGEQLLLFLQRHVEVRGDEVGDLAGVLDVHRHYLQLVRQVGDHRDEFSELIDHVRLHRLDVGGFLQLVGELTNAGGEERFAADDLDDVDAPQPLNQNAHARVGILQHLEDAAGGAARIQPVRSGLFVFGVLLRHHRQHAIAGERVRDDLQRRSA